MDKVYNHKSVEEKIYRLWEKDGYFQPAAKPKKKPFVISLPPPNVTGGLHCGHAMYVIEDIMVRYHRMLAEPSLWLPGFDHASIAVEYLVQKEIAKEGKTKKEIGREEFLRRAKKFADESRNYIREQLKKTGFSLDWSREAYTMDETRNQAVEAAFLRLYKKGLIYQGEYLVNWCPSCQSSLADLEVEYEERKDPLFYMKYGPFILATVRPETKFGDTAVAVNPEDKRYQKWIGKEFIYQSLIGPKKMRVIADQLVDPNFGTGVVKVTPGHDPNDYEMAQRHNLKILKVIDESGRLTKIAGRFSGLTISEARKKVVEELEEKGDLVKIDKEYRHRVGTCYRCGTIVEPMISHQWFVKMKPLAERAIKVVRQGKIKIIPKRFEKTYFQWLENIRDWCISRQLWWGHKIPLKGEEDILDTWFSSALWPVSIFGWPKKTTDFQKFYPTTVRETGYDILFFWVAREIMMCLEMTGKIPFKIVYLHGLVRDEKRRKFSKTAGIGFDPLLMIEKYGADALRMALVVGNPPGNDVKIAEEKIIAYRNFANKLWNIGRFILGRSGGKLYLYSPSLTGLNADDKKIIRDLNHLIAQTTSYLEKYRFDLAAEGLYHFTWHRFADQYLEESKVKMQKAKLALLQHVYRNILKLLHPFMPFITEEIWQKFPRKYDQPLIVSKWPKGIK